MVYKSGQIFLPFCHNSRVWQTDRRTDVRTDRILIARPRLHSMQRRKNEVNLCLLLHFRFPEKSNTAATLTRLVDQKLNVGHTPTCGDCSGCIWPIITLLLVWGASGKCCQFRGFPAQLGSISDSLGGQFLAVTGCGFFGRFRNLPRVLGYRGFERKPIVSWYQRCARK